MQFTVFDVLSQLSETDTDLLCRVQNASDGSEIAGDYWLIDIEDKFDYLVFVGHLSRTPPSKTKTLGDVLFQLNIVKLARGWINCTLTLPDYDGDENTPNYQMTDAEQLPPPYPTVFYTDGSLSGK